jgi:TrmH family RNA methyltransferase
MKKLIKELHDKKARAEHGLFLVEGEVSVLEFLESSYQVQSLLVTGEFLAKYKTLLSPYLEIITEVKNDELKKLGTLSSNDQAIGVFRQKEKEVFDMEDEIVIVLSDVNDPGNLGTIIRIADWYGVTKIIASKNTVDVYNSKVISATKGSFSRVTVYYEDLISFFESQKDIPVFGADLEGVSVHTCTFPKKAFLLMGSESHGIHPDLENYITQKITIPRYGSAESLNVGIATAVILDNWKG